MAIDPKAAAAAAQAAAAAAQAAAEAAAAAAATAESDAAAKLPTLAESNGREVLEDTEAVGAGEGQLDGTSMSSVLDRDLNLMSGSGRDSIASLPGLESSIPSAGGGVSSPFDLSGSFQSNQNPGFGTESISTIFRVNIEKDDAVLVNPPKSREAVVVDGETWVYWNRGGEEGGASETTTPSSTGGDTTGDTAGGQAPNPPPTGGGSTGGGSTGGGSTGGQAPNPPPVDTTPATTPPAEEEDDDDVIVVSNDSGAGGSTGVARPAPDDSGGYTGSWSGVLPIGPGSGDDDLVGGATGNTGSAGGGGLGPQGGSWAINPGSEGFVAGRETDLRDAEAWYGGISQPGDPTLEVMAGDPAMLEQGIQVVEPETVNPERSDTGETADGDAQASTAYRTMAAPSATTGGSDAGNSELPAADVAADLGSGSSEDHPPVDPGPNLPSFAGDDDDAGGSGHGRGREFGQEQGRGHGGRPDGDDDLGD